MTQTIFYAGIDVDDKSFHVAVLNKQNGELKEFKCSPNHQTKIFAIHDGIISYKRSSSKMISGVQESGVTCVSKVMPTN